MVLSVKASLWSPWKLRDAQELNRLVLAFLYWCEYNDEIEMDISLLMCEHSPGT